MKRRFFRPYIFIVFVFFLATRIVNAQEPFAYRKNAISFNLTSALVNEVNMSYEHFLSIRRSIQFTGGIVYVNDFLEDQVDDWPNSTIFSEHGFTGRFHYKMYRRQEDSTRWQSYIAAGLIYKDLYYNNKKITTEEKKDYFGSRYTETYYRDRTRKIIGVEFLWGKVFEVSRFFQFEFYYGGGLNCILSTHTDRDRYATYVDPANQNKNHPLPDFTDDMLYFRPAIVAGIKARMRF